MLGKLKHLCSSHVNYMRTNDTNMQLRSFFTEQPQHPSIYKKNSLSLSLSLLDSLYLTEGDQEVFWSHHRIPWDPSIPGTVAGEKRNWFILHCSLSAITQDPPFVLLVDSAFYNIVMSEPLPKLRHLWFPLILVCIWNVFQDILRSFNLVFYVSKQDLHTDRTYTDHFSGLKALMKMICQ